MSEAGIADHVAAYALGLRHCPAGGRTPSWRTVAKFIRGAGLGDFHPGELETAALRWGCTVGIDWLGLRRPCPTWAVPAPSENR
jgi:hypothetical protein